MSKMAEQQTEQTEDCFEEDNPNYKPPAKKTLDEIQKLDDDDESLRKYKETLLGKTIEAPFPEDPRNVIVNKLAFCSEGRPEIELDLTGDLNEIKKKTFIVKDGSQYKIRISFYVQREIVCGLIYKQKVTRKGIKVSSNSCMVGSYGPKKELHEYTTPIEDIPGGMLARGSYTVHNKFTDDDKHMYLEWEFKLEVKKDWE